MKAEEFLKTRSGAYVLERLLKIISENQVSMSLSEAVQYFKDNAVITPALGTISCGILTTYRNKWLMGWHPMQIAEELRREGIV